MRTLVWAYKPLEELHGHTGMVECDTALAAKLIKSGDAQDLRIGGMFLKQIEHTPPKKAAPSAAPQTTKRKKS